MSKPRQFGTVVDDKPPFPPNTERGYWRWNASPIISGEVGFIVVVLFALFFAGVALGALASVVGVAYRG